MTSVLDYCCDVQEHIKTKRPPGELTAQVREWFANTGRASRAVSFAVSGWNREALDLAEPLAEKYQLP